MKKILKIVVLVMGIGGAPLCFAEDLYWDVLPNPHFNTGVSPTDAVIQLKGMKVENMENLIKNECHQLSGYINQSITNWDLARHGNKSEIEAQQYSHRLALDILYPQLNMFSFPFGLKTYLTADNQIKKAIFINKNKQGIDQQDYVKQIYSQCVSQMGPEKYFSLMSNEKLMRGDEKRFDYAAFESARDKARTTISLDDSVPIGSKKSQLGIKQKLKLTDSEIQASRIMIENDVKTSVKNQNETWFLYQAINERKQNQFDEFISKGGENKEFANLIFLIVMVGETTQDFKGFDFTDVNVFENQVEQALKDMDANLEKLGQPKKHQINRFSSMSNILGYTPDELFQ